MKIVNNKTKFIPFSDVKVGEIFSIEGGTGSFYVKMEQDFCTKNAFCLSSSFSTEIKANTKCFVYDATLTLN